jgi:hypothetical protein
MQQQTNINEFPGGIEVTETGKKLNVIVIIAALPVVIAGYLIYPLVRGEQGELSGSGIAGILIFLAAYLVLIVAHELLHALGYKLFGRAKTKFGVNLKALMPYAAAQSPMSITAYRWSVVLPTLVLVPPLIFIGLDAGSFGFYVMGVLLLVSGFGDGWIMWALRKYGSNVTVMDHPSKAGCIVYGAEK